jgi:arylformamidase
LEQLVRHCKVLDLTHVNEAIGRADLECISSGMPGSKSPGIVAGDFLLFKTKNSNDQAFNPAFVYLAEEGAKYLAELGIAGVGIDALGVERSQPGHPTHKALFGAGAVIIEGLQLREVPVGSYLMVAAPLRLIGLDAAPARVLLIEE